MCSAVQCNAVLVVLYRAFLCIAVYCSVPLLNVITLCISRNPFRIFYEKESLWDNPGEVIFFCRQNQNSRPT